MLSEKCRERYDFEAEFQPLSILHAQPWSKLLVCFIGKKTTTVSWWHKKEYPTQPMRDSINMAGGKLLLSIIKDSLIICSWWEDLPANGCLFFRLKTIPFLPWSVSELRYFVLFLEGLKTLNGPVHVSFLFLNNFVRVKHFYTGSFQLLNNSIFLILPLPHDSQQLTHISDTINLSNIFTT